MGNFPNMQDAMAEWSNAVTFKVVTKSVVNHQTVEASATVKFQGVLYPSTHRELMEKESGQRAWKWWTLLTSYNLEMDDKVIDPDGTQYRVSSSANYSSAGFYQYSILQDWV